jgi:hypothetical protein
MNTIKAIKIDPEDQSVTAIEVANQFTGPNGMYEHMRTQMIEHYPILISYSDLLLVDEEANFKEPRPKEWIFDKYVVKGPALLVGQVKGTSYSDVRSKLAFVRVMCKFYPEPVCIGCNKTPEQIDEYKYGAQEYDISPNQYVRSEEGTYNPANGHFMCTNCYINAGQPATSTGWKAP